MAKNMKISKENEFKYIQLGLNISYPINWSIDDVAEFERMETEGEIIVLVDWIEDGRHIPNH